jgi:hypothetical protein
MVLLEHVGGNYQFGERYAGVIIVSLPIAAAISGLTFWTRSELNGTSFFLYQQPISRARLFYTKLSVAVFFNLLLWCLYALPVLGLNLLLALSVAAASLFLCGLLYSPLRTSNLIGFILTLFTGLAICAPAALMSAKDPAMAVFSVCMIGGVLVLLTWWNNVKCDVLKPGIRREARQAAFGALLLVWSLTVALTHPIDLLYLVGFDWYAH